MVQEKVVEHKQKEIVKQREIILDSYLFCMKVKGPVYCQIILNHYTHVIVFHYDISYFDHITNSYHNAMPQPHHFCFENHNICTFWFKNKRAS